MTNQPLSGLWFDASGPQADTPYTSIYHPERGWFLLNRCLSIRISYVDMKNLFKKDTLISLAAKLRILLSQLTLPQQKRCGKCNYNGYNHYRH